MKKLLLLTLLLLSCQTVSSADRVYVSKSYDQTWDSLEAYFVGSGAFLLEAVKSKGKFVIEFTDRDYSKAVIKVERVTERTTALKFLVYKGLFPDSVQYDIFLSQILKELK